MQLPEVFHFTHVKSVLFKCSYFSSVAFLCLVEPSGFFIDE